ncbi:hypothetical protein PVK06_031683 [Gossypium arboreum]|uniref:UBN2 domain-containing protein n=1 Tax=Gossypium arboreum TaxID=29729 RepID=A0ABR0NSB5_GOSAR|nr:hypothetical protein PVK06_031683 [Gossypium arboreum]
MSFYNETPTFSGTNYNETNNYEVWRVITHRSSIPKKRAGDSIVLKEEDECDEVNVKKLNAKAMHTLFIGLNEHNRFSICGYAKEIWEKLKVTHKGTSRVKESRISLITLDYELFKAKPRKKIKDMSNRLTNIVNGLKALQTTYPNKEMVTKHAQ